ncbi:SnoaL-like domain-containing protein [Flammeovirga sp. MY04]|uniref:nuclear transport factor 2 family protein n=1 Tax=Flammeovirga sp. MY04 TaxID=1191459 RepID=UPI000806106D|nr:nuclear transport factor 2 family protein [Flammeovirga sp. MY04]ANQ49204.1 SnoaL-like domain-containing protein [Flammeovirga sp. MY04]
MNTIQIDLEKLQKSNWTEEEFKNAEIVVHFIQKLMNDHDFDYIKKTYSSQRYKQHNQSMIDGIDGVLDVVSNFAKRYPDYCYDVKHIYVDGEYVTVHSHSTNKKKHRGNPQKGLNIMDTWRVVDGEIVEHWDAVQPIHGFMRFFFWLVGGKFKNQNTYF